LAANGAHGNLVLARRQNIHETFGDCRIYLVNQFLPSPQHDYVYFAGFDEVACLAGRSVNPRKTMPLAIGGTLLGATIISTSAQFALGGMSSNVLNTR
jgi:hypothetical protein